MKTPQIKLPDKVTPELAEFIGILAGDGYIRYDRLKSDYIVEIVGDLNKDKEYLEKYVYSLINNLFNVYPKVYRRKNQNLLILRINSKIIYKFIRELGFPSGKKNNFEIPQVINNENMVFFIKGLADTDFSLALKKRSITNIYPVITLKLKSSNVIKKLAVWLKNNGFKISMGIDYVKEDKRGYKKSKISFVDLNGISNYKRWMEIIGFRNKRHLIKIKKYESKNGTSGI